MKLKRLLAGLLDYCIINIICAYLSSWIFKDYSVYYSSKSESIRFLVLSVVIFMTFWTFKDCVFKNASIGKKLLQIKVVYVDKENKGKIDILTHLKRSIPSILSIFELSLLLVGYNRLGDIWAKTTVVKE